MANTVSNVYAGKPGIAGGVWVAPKGTSAPTDSTTALASAFKCLGYINEDGVTVSTTRESDDVRDWGGDVILNPQTEYTDTLTFTAVEGVNEDVLKLVYGADNVTGDLATGLTVNVNSKELDEWVVVIETLLRDGGTHRDVYPIAKPTEIGEVTYNRSDPVGYEITMTAYPDATGNTHHIYAKSA